jgi:LDH2 family malate/lactate/ureidoglycolate dehydrogenase
MPPYDYPVDGVVIDAEALLDWTRGIVGRTGTPPDIAEDVAQVLLAADLRGIASHGTSRLGVYVALVEAGITDARERPERIGGTSVLAHWDARNGWGQHGGRVMMDDAIDRAATLGLAASIARHANHYGIAGWYAMRAAAQGMIGISTSNSTPLVVPTRGRTRQLGTNPIALAAPAGRFGMFVLDMATSAVTWGRLQVAARRGLDLPHGVAVDSAGRITTSPGEALDGGALLPLGSTEELAGYKGYGLALVADILSGVLGDAAFGPWVLPFSLEGGPSNLGQLFMAIDPNAVGPGFEERLETLIAAVVGSAAAPDAPGPILYPGQLEAEREADQRRHGIVLDAGHLDYLQQLATRLELPLPEVRPASSVTRGPGPE